MNHDDQDDTAMCGWTIYCRPLDFPNHYVVRMWRVGEEGQILHHMEAVLCESLEEARTKVPPSCICFPRDPEDDPVIVETWL